MSDAADGNDDKIEEYHDATLHFWWDNYSHNCIKQNYNGRTVDSFDLEIIASLKEKGYNFMRHLGEGHFSRVYEVMQLHKNPKESKRLVAKVQAPYKDCKSVQHRLNASKRDVTQNEVTTLLNLDHPNIVKIIDHYKGPGFSQDCYSQLELEELLSRGLKNRQNVTRQQRWDPFLRRSKDIIIQEFFEAISLDDYVLHFGPLHSHEKFCSVFGQIIDALKYLHVEKGMVHRDIKPDNILISLQEDLVKIADFQTAQEIAQLQAKMHPTRGSSSFTSPELLHTMSQGKMSVLRVHDDIYSLGALMYTALTGDVPFDYRVIETQDPRGRTIEYEPPLIEMEPTMNVVMVGEKNVLIDKLNYREHDSKLEKKLGTVDTVYHDIIFNMLRLQGNPYRALNPKEMHALLNNQFKELEQSKKKHRETPINAILDILAERSHESIVTISEKPDDISWYWDLPEPYFVLPKPTEYNSRKELSGHTQNNLDTLVHYIMAHGERSFSESVSFVRSSYRNAHSGSYGKELYECNFDGLIISVENVYCVTNESELTETQLAQSVKVGLDSWDEQMDSRFRRVVNKPDSSSEYADRFLNAFCNKPIECEIGYSWEWQGLSDTVRNGLSFYLYYTGAVLEP